MNASFCNPGSIFLHDHAASRVVIGERRDETTKDEEAQDRLPPVFGATALYQPLRRCTAHINMDRNVEISEEQDCCTRNHSVYIERTGDRSITFVAGPVISMQEVTRSRRVLGEHSWDFLNLWSSMVRSSCWQRAFNSLVATLDTNTDTVFSRHVDSGLPRLVSISSGGDTLDGEPHDCTTSRLGVVFYSSQPGLLPSHG
ncbi:hypothetical protein BLA15816_04314 [Burkholderia lata]|nr:hypothetical protein BLA15816_04314 [Burkholderia lata]